MITSNPIQAIQRLNQIPKALTHPQRLILTLHKHHLPRLPIRMLRIPLRLLLLQLLIQINQNHPENPESDNRHAVHGRHDAVALAVPILLETPHVRAGHVAELAEGVDEGQCDGALGGGSREGGADPGVEDDEAGVRAGLEEEGDVAGCDVEGGHADDEADEAHEEGAVDVPDLGWVSCVRKDGCWRLGLTFSWVRSACQALRREKRQEKTHGGALMRRVGT